MWTLRFRCTGLGMPCVTIPVSYQLQVQFVWKTCFLQFMLRYQKFAWRSRIICLFLEAATLKHFFLRHPVWPQRPPCVCASHEVIIVLFNLCDSSITDGVHELYLLWQLTDHNSVSWLFACTWLVQLCLGNNLYLRRPDLCSESVSDLCLALFFWVYRPFRNCAQCVVLGIGRPTRLLN